MSRRRVETQACSECGTERTVQPFECDNCLLTVRVPLDDEKGATTKEPPGWIIVYERAGDDPWPMYTGDTYTTAQPRQYCSWSCLGQALPMLRGRNELSQGVSTDA